MPITSKKLPSNTRAVRVFYIGTERKLTNVESGSSVWIQFPKVYRELLIRRARVPYHLGRGKSASDPLLYICQTYSANLKRAELGVWYLINPISAGRQATEEDLLVLQIESSLEMDKST